MSTFHCALNPAGFAASAALVVLLDLTFYLLYVFFCLLHFTPVFYRLSEPILTWNPSSLIVPQHHEHLLLLSRTMFSSSWTLLNGETFSTLNILESLQELAFSSGSYHSDTSTDSFTLALTAANVDFVPTLHYAQPAALLNLPYHPHVSPLTVPEC